MTTPNIDAAIRAGCDAVREPETGRCRYPECKTCDTSILVIAALRAVIPKDQTDEMLEIAAQVICLAEGENWSRLRDTARINISRNDYRNMAVCAYKAQPIYLELWGDE